MSFYRFASYQTVQFRFVLNADVSINVENGWAFDDFEIQPLNMDIVENLTTMLHIYPNPANKYLWIEGSGLKTVEWEIVYPDGRLLFFSECGCVILYSRGIQLNLSEFSNGIQVVRISVNNQFQKFIIQR